MKKILLIEDDPFIVDIYTAKFKKAGFSIEVASDGETAFEKIKIKKFDILVLDIVLPHVNGWEILEKIKKDPTLKGLKILILSNLGQEEEIKKGLKLGATEYLVKAHHTPSEIVKKIEKIICR